MQQIIFILEKIKKIPKAPNSGIKYNFSASGTVYSVTSTVYSKNPNQFIVNQKQLSLTTL